MKIALHQSTFDPEDIEAACEVLRSGFLTMGKLCAEFEEAFAHLVEVRHAVFVNSGSSANLLAFFALANHAIPRNQGKRQLTPGCEVMVPALTWSTTIWPIVQAGAVPVIVDCDPETLQMDLDQAARAVSDKTVAIAPVHVLGNAVPADPLLSIAANHALWIVEDACEALGTRWNGRPVGSYGDLGTFSFYYSHHITTIEGGMVVTSDERTAELLRCLRAHGWTRQLIHRSAVESLYPELDRDYLFVNTGFNVRPTEVNAALGLRQIRKLEVMNRRRNEIVRYWCEELSPLFESGLLRTMRLTSGTQASWFGFPVICRSPRDRADLKAHLRSCNIETRPIICGNMARQPAMQHVPHRVVGSLSGADEVMQRGLYWGAHPTMTQEEIAYVSKCVKDFYQ